MLKASRSSIDGSLSRQTCYGWCCAHNRAPVREPSSPTTCGCTAHELLEASLATSWIWMQADKLGIELATVTISLKLDQSEPGPKTRFGV